MKKALTLALTATLLLCLAAPALAFTAVLSPQNLTVNGERITCEKYNIDGSNYFKLRDIALLLNGTDSQFSVGWDAASSTVSIVSGEEYTPNGTELAVDADKSSTAVPSTQTILINGVRNTDLSVYNLDGNNFFRLRDLGVALGFEVDYDGATNTAIVNSVPVNVPAPAPTPIRSLTLTSRYTAGGRTNPTYFDEKAFGSAVCGDVDGDGRMEIVYGIRAIMCIDAATGELEWRVPCGHDITEGLNPALDYAGEAFAYAPPFRLLDYDGDGVLDIFTVTNVYGTSRCNIAVYDGSGRYKAHWTTDKRVWAACVDDIDGDGKCEVAVGYGVGKAGMNGEPSIYLYNNDGSLRWSRPCWYGMFSDSIAAVDLDRDGKKELVLLYDDNGVVAFHADGTEVTSAAFGGKKWSEILLYEAVDERTAYTSRDNMYGLMGTRSGLIADDLDGDGRQELIGVGMIVQMGVVEENMANDAGISFDDSALYFTAFILNTDRTRYKNEAKGYDWSRFPIDVGPLPTPLDSDLIANPVVRPVTADVSGDSDREILYSSYDGMVHCFSLDGTYGVTAMAFKLGNWRNKNYFDSNAMPKKMTIILGDERFTVEFTHEQTVQWVTFSAPVYVDNVTILIDDVYKGTKYEDTCINEISVYGTRMP